MPTIRIATDCTLPPARVLRAAYDFGPDRTQVWPAVRAEHLTVHQLSDTTADATEGTPAGIGINWERCDYDWSQPGRRQRDGDHLAALAGDGQRPVAAFQAQLLDVGAGGLGDSQPVQREQGDQRMLGRRASPAATRMAPSSLRSRAAAWDS